MRQNLALSLESGTFRPMTNHPKSLGVILFTEFRRIGGAGFS